MGGWINCGMKEAIVGRGSNCGERKQQWGEGATGDRKQLSGEEATVGRGGNCGVRIQQ